MGPEEKARAIALHLEIESVRNLRPKAFDLATDPAADIKARWNAFDELYEAVCEGLLMRGLSPNDFLSPQPPSVQPLTADQLDRARRSLLALTILTERYGPIKQGMNLIMKQAEELVPSPPNPETGGPMLTMKDQALMNELTNLMRTELPEDWERFFNAVSETAASRRLGFARMYAVISKKWMEQSLFPRSLTPEQRQKWVVISMMCHVPGDQWSEKDLDQLYADLLPVEELN